MEYGFEYSITYLFCSLPKQKSNTSIFHQKGDETKTKRLKLIVNYIVKSTR